LFLTKDRDHVWPLKWAPDGSSHLTERVVRPLY